MPASSNICWKDCSARVVRDAWFDDTGRGPGRCEHPNGPFYGHGWKNLFGGGRKLRRGDETSGARYRKARNFPDPWNSIGCLVSPGIPRGRSSRRPRERAARLQALSAPGGVCLSGEAHQYARKVLSLVYEDLGHQSVHNIEEPIRAYRMASLGLDGSSWQSPFRGTYRFLTSPRSRSCRWSI